ncbi:MAG TPA: hypothetical protein VGM18_13910 [Candidatus Sulfotelmatobacter sp.]
MADPKALSNQLRGSRQSGQVSIFLPITIITLVLSLVALPLTAREKDATQYGMGLIVNLPFPESEVDQVVRDVIQNGIIRGTKEYNKDEYMDGAAPAASTHVFKEWTDGGKVFYKVRLHAIDPRNFKDTNDVGTLAVRYVIQAQSDKNTVLHIDAIFVEDFRHVSHPSNGSVESAEYKDIHDRLDAIAAMKAETVEAEKEKQDRIAKNQGSSVAPEVSSSSSKPPQALSTPQGPATATSAGSAANASAQPGSPTPQTLGQATLDQHVKELRQQVVRLIKAPGAPLKSAPFHTASTLQSLPSGTEILIVISTPYWFGVETHEGQHGWILRDELEQAP